MLEKLIAHARDVLPARSTMITVLGAFALGAMVSSKGISCRQVPVKPDPSLPPTAQSLVKLGKTYTINLGKVYASAWEAGAAALEAGKPVSAALGVVHESWDRDRGQLFDRSVSVEFAKLVPEGKADGDVTAAERAALAKAWRSFATGLRK